MKSQEKIMSAMRSVLIIAIVLFANIAYSTGIDFDLEVRKTDQRSFMVMLNYNEVVSFDICLKDAYGIVLWEEDKHQSNAFNKQFNLKHLQDGTYFFEIENESALISYRIELNNNEIFVQDQTNIVKPSIQQDGDSFIYAMNSPENSSVEIMIHDSNFELLFNETELSEEILKKFDFSKTPNGTYYISTTINGREFVKSVVKN